MRTRPPAPFLDQTKPSYAGGMLQFANTKLWGSWSSLIDSLRTGNPPSRMGGEDDFFAALYNTPENLREFLAAMTGLSTSRAGHRTPPAAACACPRSPVVGGALIVYDAIIDDERRENASGLLMSLNMLVETRAGSDYTGEDCQGWMADVGFRETHVEPLVGPESMVVAIK